jgi:hypothetical protein
MSADSGYAGRKVALLTQHGKQTLLAPILEPALGCRLEQVLGYDTDQLGSFSREIPRAGSQLDAARRKARVGMELAGLPLGLASEGAFGPDPVSGMLPWNMEILVWIDDELGLEVVGRAQGPGCHVHLLTPAWDRAAEFAEKIGFPAQQIILRPDHGDDPRIQKDIRSWTAFSEQFRATSTLSPTGCVFIESDGRAHANPMRQKLIGCAAQDLLLRLTTGCPCCGAPGFGQIEPIPGLPCGICENPTALPRADRFGCPRCDHREIHPRSGSGWAAPANCSYCNP